MIERDGRWADSPIGEGMMISGVKRDKRTRLKERKLEA